MADGTPPLSARIAGHDFEVSTEATLVVGFDRRPESSAALLEAEGLAARLHARINVVHAIDLADFSGGS